MQTLIKYVSFITFICLLNIQTVSSQIVYIKDWPKTSSKILAEYNKRLPLKDSVTGKDYSFKTFLNEINTSVSYYYLTIGGKQRKIHRDSLLEYIQPKIDRCIEAYSQTPDEGFEDIEEGLKKSIFSEIKSLQIEKEKGDLYVENVNSLKLKNSIINLPDSKAKVWLLLQFSDLQIKNKTYEQQVNLYNSEAKLIAEKITDVYDRGKAYTYIGNFSLKYEVNDVALEMYYKAKKYFYHCKRDSIVKYTEQGHLDEKIADIFAQRKYKTNQVKNISYRASAGSYYLAAKDTERLELCTMNILSSWVYLKYDLSGDKEIDAKEELQLLRGLGEWYRNYREQDSIIGQSEADSWGLFSVATILRAQKKYESALNYYLEALMNLTNINAPKHLHRSIINVSFAYALLGKERLSNKYLDWAQSIAKKTNSTSDFLWNALNKSYNYFYLKKYDSALLLANRIQFDTALLRILPNPFYNQFIGFVYSIKNQLLDSLRLDSARLYQSYYQNNLNSYLEEYFRLSQIEAKESQDWLTDIKDDQIETEIQSKIGIQKTAQIQKAADKDTRVILIIVFGAILLIGLILYLFVREQNKKRIKEKERQAQEEELRRVDAERENLIKSLKLQVQQGMNHEFSSFTKQVLVLAEERKKELETSPDLKNTPGELFDNIIKTLTAISSYISKYHSSTQNEITDICDEIDMSRSFLAVFEIEQKLQGRISIINEITDEFVLQHLPLPSHFLNNFIMNSIKYGLKGGHTKHLDINIRSYETEDHGYTVEIEDNGCGINYAKSITTNTKKESTGFNWAKDLAYKFNKNDLGYSIDFSDNLILDKSDTGLGSGTLVIINFKRK